MAFDEWIAQRYETLWPELFDPAVLDPAVDFLAALAGAGPALEFGVGTGRVALPLSRRGITVHGVDVSAAMLRRLRAQPGGEAVGVTAGDLASVTVPGRFRLVYLLRNTITNLTTEDAQVAAFGNAARHLLPGGHFVVENYVPALRRLPPGVTRHVFTATETHLGFEEYDFARQIAHSHHRWTLDGEPVEFSSPHRYLWPSELDLMARLAGLARTGRWAGWTREPFGADSPAHVSVWRKDSGG
jgi:SAM-dependent methyltransferase